MTLAGTTGHASTAAKPMVDIDAIHGLEGWRPAGGTTRGDSSTRGLPLYAWISCCCPPMILP